MIKINLKKILFLNFLMFVVISDVCWSSDDNEELKFCQIPSNVKIIKGVPPDIYKKVKDSSFIENSAYSKSYIDIFPLGTIVHYDTASSETIDLFYQEPDFFWQDIWENDSIIYYNQAYRGEETLTCGYHYSEQENSYLDNRLHYTMNREDTEAHMLGDIQNENHFSWFKNNSFNTFFIKHMRIKEAFLEKEIYKIWLRILKPKGQLVYLSVQSEDVDSDQINLYKNQFLEAGFRKFQSLNIDLVDFLNYRKLNHSNLILMCDQMCNQIIDSEVQRIVKETLLTHVAIVIIVTK